MVTNARGQTVMAGTGEPVTRARINGILDDVMDVRPVASATARAQLVSDLVAAGQGPSPSRPLYVDRADAPALAHIERTQDGTTWETLFTEVGRTYTNENTGGGNLTTAWAEATNPAVLNLPPGRYLVVAMINVTVSAANITRIESHLFEGSGPSPAPLGTGQQAISPIEAVGVVTTRTIDFTRLVTITGTSGTGRLNVRTRVGVTGGSIGAGAQSLTAIRLPG